MHLVLHFGRLQLPIGSCLKLRDNENLYRTVGFYKGKLSADMQQVQEFISCELWTRAAVDDINVRPCYRCPRYQHTAGELCIFTTDTLRAQAWNLHLPHM